MRFFEQSKLAMCFGVVTMLGACGADPSLDEDQEQTETSTGNSAAGGGSDAGRGTGNNGGNSGSSNGGSVDAGASSDAGAATDAAAEALPSLDIGQDTPKEPASRFEFVVTRAQETPACDAGSDDALGLGRVVIADSGRWVEVTVGALGLSGAITNAHVHFGAAGAAGPIVLDFGKLPKGDVFFKRFTEADFPKQRPANAPAAFPADFAALVASVREGGTYVNLHTAACKTGEVRGQIVE
ncbi:MAG: CHRD domain-containing protein [Polyangiales bacterium]